MSLWLLLVAAALLSLERLCYLYISHTPERFRRFCQRPAVASLGEPVEVLQKLFYGFKALQFAVFLGWCYVHGQGSLAPVGRGVLPLAIGGALIVVGQMLNGAVFYRLGKVGVFYGNKLGYEIPWSQEFPFSWFKHPQYVGTVCSIWGFFVVMRFPHHDWYMLPALETVYYALGAAFEG
jgi:phosphatidyl-N-methylethanolamine N-methyltransferase